MAVGWKDPHYPPSASVDGVGGGGITQDHSQGPGLSSWQEDLLPELGHLGRGRLWEGVVNLRCLS